MQHRRDGRRVELRHVERDKSRSAPDDDQSDQEVETKEGGYAFGGHHAGL